MGPRTGLDDAERRKIFTLPGIEPRLIGLAACSLVAIPTGIIQYSAWLRAGKSGFGPEKKQEFLST
jgi:hypothetical protein